MGFFNYYCSYLLRTVSDPFGICLYLCCTSNKIAENICTSKL
jgi:hypothetical protein